jgi:hypothetical protein
MSFRCDRLDAAVAEEVLKALQPADLELALAALQELEARDQTILRQWQMRIERAEYEAALAERRYQEVDLAWHRRQSPPDACTGILPGGFSLPLRCRFQPVLSD